MASSSANSVELAVALPLGVVANQLMRVEADLRLLNAKAYLCATERENSSALAQVAARLEKINETIETIRGLVAELEADIQPASARSGSRRARSDRDD